MNLLNEMAKTTNMKKLAISVMDPIFNYISREQFKQSCNENLSDVTIIIYTPAMVIQDENEINKLIKENHDTPSGGHVGINKLLLKLRRKYYWKNMKNSISKYVKNCISCKLNKHSIKTQENFEKTTTPTKPFELVSIDTVGPLTRSIKGNRYALTLQCDLTKYIVTVPIVDKQASTLAKALVEHFILIYGCPRAIKSDMGTEYKNEVFQQIYNILEINQKFSTAYHPETIGALERSHRCLNEYLRQFINEQHDDWDSWLPYFTFFYNTTPHTEHSFAPFELIFGTQVNYPTKFKNNTTIDPIYNFEAYYKELQFKLHTAALKAKLLLEKSKEKRISKQIQNSNPIEIQTGSKVWLKKENRRKLDPVYTGPFTIIEINHPNVTIKNQMSNETQTVHKNRIII